MNLLEDEEGRMKNKVIEGLNMDRIVVAGETKVT